MRHIYIGIFLQSVLCKWTSLIADTSVMTRRSTSQDHSNAGKNDPSKTGKISWVIPTTDPRWKIRIPALVCLSFLVVPGNVATLTIYLKLDGNLQRSYARSRKYNRNRDFYLTFTPNFFIPLSSFYIGITISQFFNSTIRFLFNPSLVPWDLLALLKYFIEICARTL